MKIVRRKAVESSKTALPKKNIRAAEQDEVDTRLKDIIDQLGDDFDYLTAGLEKLGRVGSSSMEDGIAIAQSMSQAIQQHLSQIADVISDTSTNSEGE